MGSLLLKCITPSEEKLKAEIKRRAEEAKQLNYDEPVFKCLCCYFFHRRPSKLMSDLEPPEEAPTDPAMEAKAKKMAQILFFQDDLEAGRRRDEAFRKMLELERQPVPLVFRLYQWGQPAPLEFTDRCLRQEARLGLCNTLDDFLK